MHIGHIECTCSSYLIFEIYFVKMAMHRHFYKINTPSRWRVLVIFFRKKWDFYMVTEYVLKHKKSVTPAPSYFVWFIRNTYAICVCAKHLLHLTSFSTYAICVLHNMKEF